MDKKSYLSSIKRNSQRLYLIALSYTAKPDDAEDIIQNVYLKLWKNKKPFENEAHIDKWLTRVCVNECKSFLSSPFRKKTVSMEQCRQSYSLNDDREYDIISAVMQLKQKERVIIHLFYFEDFTVKEIACLLRIKEGTVKTRLSRARAKLKNILGEDYNEI